MKKYEAPEITVVELVPTDVIAATLTEDNETGWFDSWTSGVLDANKN